MLDIHELEAFEQRVKKKPAVRAFLEDAISKCSLHMDAEGRDLADLGATGLWAVANAALLLLTKVGIDYLRGLSELALAKKRFELVGVLTQEGWDRKDVVALFDSFFRRIRAESDGSVLLRSLKAMESQPGGG
jgi:hypothetical protein